MSHFAWKEILMALDDSRGAFTQTGDTRPAPGAMNPAWGRSGTDLASDSGPDAGPDAITPTDADTFSGSDTDPDAAGRMRDRERKRTPDIPPDERLGLRPTVPPATALVTDHPTYPV